MRSSFVTNQKTVHQDITLIYMHDKSPFPWRESESHADTIPTLPNSAPAESHKPTGNDRTPLSW